MWEEVIAYVQEEYVQAILLSIGCGSVIGLEREYKNKSAGLRTVILICFGATIFTLISRMGNISDDRIAANIVTGIGFLGAGVIYQGKFSVQGLTTAAVIWTMAAIGMSIGFGEFKFGIFLTVLMVIVLSLFQKMEDLLADIYFVRTMHITFIDHAIGRMYELEQFMRDNNIKPLRKGVEKNENQLIVAYEIIGNRKRINILSEKIIALEYVYSVNSL
ncbi:MgtC/SapB family protein [Sphingobacterium sp. SGG-5]|uniref:MgtC/SapB family protein n=1 Tax=Sphingobacterium sp. SGG-5 TaxID=2710881 RepID=UPI0013EB7D01|nr:MgtC/SapB family protein [Sphingobacterium sp. SGG-5]NGM61285.1 MgtC/SapB family protein [Sphingobacterium sp. SGG-5]